MTLLRSTTTAVRYIRTYVFGLDGVVRSTGRVEGVLDEDPQGSSSHPILWGASGE